MDQVLWCAVEVGFCYLEDGSCRPQPINGDFCDAGELPETRPELRPVQRRLGCCLHPCRNRSLSQLVERSEQRRGVPG